MTMRAEYKRELLSDAQDKLWECIELLDEACKDDPNAQAYLVDQLRVHVDREHGGILSNDLTIDNLLDNINKKGD